MPTSKFAIAYQSCWGAHLDPGVFTIIIIFFPHWWLSYNKLSLSLYQSLSQDVALAYDMQRQLSSSAFACFPLVLAPTHTSAVAQMSQSVFAVSNAAVTLRQDGEQPPETAAQADCATRCAGTCTKDVEDPGPTGIPVCAGEYT